MATEERECRICLTSKNDSNSGFYIHLNSSSVFQPLQPILFNLTGIDYFQNKDISSWICDQCENKLMDFDRFRKKCSESNDVFLKRAGIKTTFNEKLDVFESSLLKRLDNLYAKNVRIKRIKLDPVKVDLIEEEIKVLSEHYPNKKEPEKSELNLLKRLDVQDINKQCIKQLDPVKFDLNEENNLSENNAPIKQEEESCLSLLERLEYNDKKAAEVKNDVKQDINLQVVDPVEDNLNEDSELSLWNRPDVQDINKQTGFEQLDPVIVDLNDKKDLSEIDAPKQEEESCLSLLEQLEKIEYSDENATEVKNEVKQDINLQVVDPVEGNLNEKVNVLSKQISNQPTFEGYQNAYMCPQCTKKIYLFGSLMEHLNTDHPTVIKKTPIKKNECTICNKVLRHQISLNAHIVSSHIRYCCDNCKQFFRDNEIPIHERSCNQKTKANKYIETTKQLEKTSVLLKEDTTNCRTCLATTKEEKHFIDIFLNANYPEIFLSCTGIDIYSTPRMTTWMCITCETKLTDFYNFQRECWESDWVLRKIQK